jgi:endonuclease YncB( thermonuclease family)
VGRVAIIPLAALLLLWSSLALAAVLSGQASVIDGDTIEIHGQRIRFFGIDAPESHQTCGADQQTYRCGQQAALALADHVGQQTVSCEKRDVDRYGRIVAVCRAGGEDLNAWMVSQGWALAYRHYSTAYVSEEDAARVAKLGIWRGTFTAPWDWRHGQRTSTDAAAPAATTSAGSTGACCKICSASQACGDACISKTKTCHKPPGCACDVKQ